MVASKIRSVLLHAFLAVPLMFSATCFAHSPIFDCYDNGDGTGVCEAAYSDGSSTYGTQVHIEAASGRILAEGTFDDTGSFYFTIPDEEYQAVFDGGKGHQLVVLGDDIY